MSNITNTVRKLKSLIKEARQEAEEAKEIAGAIKEKVEDMEVDVTRIRDDVDLMVTEDQVPDPAVEWLEADIQEPFPAAMRGRFAWCSCNFGVLHLARPEDFFTAALQVLQPGGLFVFTVWADLARSPAFRIPLGAIERHGSMDVGLPPGPPFFKYSDPKVAREALAQAGFEAATVSAELVDMRWELDEPEELWTVFLEGTARTGGILDKQTPTAREAIEKAMRDAVVAAQGGSGGAPPPYALPQPCLRVTANAPG